MEDPRKDALAKREAKMNDSNFQDKFGKEGIKILIEKLSPWQKITVHILFHGRNQGNYVVQSNVFSTSVY